MSEKGCDIGLIGMGVMGRNFALNMADHGFSVAVYNRTAKKTRDFMDKEGAGRHLQAGFTIREFVGLLHPPRAIIIMVSAGAPVDAVIKELIPHLDTNDLIIDSGNSHFNDTDRRGKFLAKKGLLYMGMGISGGEKGARFGPSLMPGGPSEGYERVSPILEAASAKVNGEACVTYLGSGSAGHYVKMVHNGIEYGLEQLIAESYDLMRRGLGLSNDELHDVYRRWNEQELASYLIEITSQIFLQADQKTDKRLIDCIVDVARQKGTGIWTSHDAMDLRVPVPTIDIAVTMRNLSGLKEERGRASQVLQGPRPVLQEGREGFIDKIKNALYASIIVTYAQGMALLRQASASHGYDLDLEAVARIWRGGCIIRAALLEDLRRVYQENPDLHNPLMVPQLGRQVMGRQADWRSVVGCAAAWGIPAPALMVSLAYYDAYRSARLPANLTQAQRDYFGSHTYERVDMEGVFHTQWS